MTKSSVATLYKERLVPGISFYLATLFAPTALFLIVLAFDEFWALVAFTASEVIIIAASIALAPRIEVSATTLRVGRAAVPRTFVGKVSVIPKSEVFAERGPNLDIRSYALFQIGVKELVKLEITDPKDSTPYWLFASRKPKKLLNSLTRKS
jgi:hypothetical protein